MVNPVLLRAVGHKRLTVGVSENSMFLSENEMRNRANITCVIGTSSIFGVGCHGHQAARYQPSRSSLHMLYYWQRHGSLSPPTAVLLGGT